VTLRWLLLSGGMVALDQASKFLASRLLVLHDPVPVLPLFNLTLAHNTGAAFSFLRGAGGWQRWLFSILAVAVSVAIVFWIRRLPATARWTAAALALVLGGALGNLWDRLAHGYVVDFIDLYYGPWHFPTFNLADSAISVGAAMLLLELFLPQRRR
jgi:signal peptidase II